MGTFNEKIKEVLASVLPAHIRGHSHYTVTPCQASRWAGFYLAFVILAASPSFLSGLSWRHPDPGTRPFLVGMGKLPLLLAGGLFRIPDLHRRARPPDPGCPGPAADQSLDRKWQMVIVVSAGVGLWS